MEWYLYFTYQQLYINFETGKSITNPKGRVTFKVTDNMHIYLTDYRR